MSDTQKEKGVNITRTFNAPRDVVFTAFTDAKILAKWWGPKGFTNPVCEFDAKDGGKIYIEMTGPDGAKYPMGGTVHEIIKPSLLVFSGTAFENEDGESQLEDVSTLTFGEEDGNTRLNLHAIVIKATGEAAEAVKGMEEGWSQSFDRLEAVLKE